MNKTRLASSSLLALFGFSFAGSAEPLNTQISGYGRVAYSYNDQEMSYAKSSHELDIGNSSWVGIQFDTAISDNVRTSVQLTAKGHHDFKPLIQNAYLEYSLPDYHTNLQLGRFRIPSFHYSEYVDIGYGYPMYRPNDAVYRYIAMFNMTGISARSYVELGQGRLELQPFLGMGHILAEDNTFGNIDLYNAFGLVARYNLGHWSYRAAYATAETKDDINPEAFIIANQRARQLSIGTQYQDDRHYLNFEAVRIELTGTFADVQIASLIYGYQLEDWMPYVGFSALESIDDADRANLPPTLQQHKSTSYSAGARYELTDNMALKFDLTYADFHDTSGAVADNVLNPVNFQYQFKDATIYSVALDFIF